MHASLSLSTFPNNTALVTLVVLELVGCLAVVSPRQSRMEMGKKRKKERETESNRQRDRERMIRLPPS
jgi:hypothetical protein